MPFHSLLLLPIPFIELGRPDLFWAGHLVWACPCWGAGHHHYSHHPDQEPGLGHGCSACESRCRRALALIVAQVGHVGWCWPAYWLVIPVC